MQQAFQPISFDSTGFELMRESQIRTIAAAGLTVTRLRRVVQALRASLPMPVRIRVSAVSQPAYRIPVRWQ